MISVEFARQLLLQNVIILNEVNIPLEKAEGYVISKDLCSPVDMPFFNQSSMDGYAVAFNNNENIFKVVGEVQAGRYYPEILKFGEAVRIFTGAPVPDGSNAVLMQENAFSDGGFVSCRHQKPEQNENIRFKGEQIKKGEIAIKKGELLTPAAIGFLASLGISDVDVFRKPSVAIIASGDELQKPGAPLANGMAYESFLPMARAALLKMGINDISVKTVKDNEKEITGTLSESLNNMDAVILCGGISVGDYDFSKTALEKAGVENIFYKVMQKPGKPLFFGKKGGTLVFALPGNPAAALTCFYEYVFPALNQMQYRKSPTMLTLSIPLLSKYTKTGNLPFFLKGIANADGVEILEGQTSHMLRSFSQANCIVYLPAGKKEAKAGELVEIHMLPL